MSTKKPFWEAKRLDTMTPTEWESLCDGCGRCCAIKLEDGDTGAIHYTDVVCRLFDDRTCRCGNYNLRSKLVPGCVVLTPKKLPEVAHWMPSTCAYRLLHEGKPLFDWHPLITGDPESVHAAGISLRGKVIPEYEVEEDDLEDHIVTSDE
ncbi:MAG TPA: YcgN family cysteine cluster protein [Devosiaceae bacterium]|nr:YcgN family cysteine cluster protein [Devosiaceae bacterium]